MELALRAPALLLAAGLCASCAPPDEAPDEALLGAGAGPDTPVVLIVIDTLRADHLGTYGYWLDTSPALDAFAAEAYVFEANSTQSNSTFPSITSILTGLYPKTHRDYMAVPLAGATQRDASVVTLAQILSARGHHAIGVASHPGWVEGLEAACYHGWDRFSTIPASHSPGERITLANAGFTNERALAALDEHADAAADRPLFLWTHYFDPHTDQRVRYRPPPAFESRFLAPHMERAGHADLVEVLAPLVVNERFRVLEERFGGDDLERLRLAIQRSLYDAEIAYCDSEIARLFDRLRELEVYDRALIVVVSDHGENLEEASLHGPIAFGHNRLFEPVVHVPLLVKLPGQRTGRRVSAITQSIDIAPTVCELLGLPDGERMEGRSLVPLLRAPTGRLHDEVYVESSDAVEKAIKTEVEKYIDPGRGDDALLYRWRDDPREERDLARSAAPERVDDLARRLRAFRPKDLLRLRWTPDAAPYEASVELRLGRGSIESGVGPGFEIVDAERRVARWQVTVSSVPVDLLLEPRDLETSIEWTIRRAGVQSVQDRVYLGRKPLTRTTAVPVYDVLEGSVNERASVRFDHRTEPLALELAIDAEGTRGIEVDVRYEHPAYGQVLEPLELEGFALGPVPARIWMALEGEGPRARARIGRAPDGGRLLVGLRLDGAWPDVERVAVDGRGADPSRCRFVMPFPTDARVGTALLLAPDLDRLAPGSLVIWTASGGTGVELDTEGIDEELVRQLRDLGYVR